MRELVRCYNQFKGESEEQTNLCYYIFIIYITAVTLRTDIIFIILQMKSLMTWLVKSHG